METRSKIPVSFSNLQIGLPAIQTVNDLYHRSLLILTSIGGTVVGDPGVVTTKERERERE